LRVEDVKNLPLDGYRATLNMRLLGEEWVPLYAIVCFSIAKKNNWEWEIRENNEGS
jgi:hypothetical protein